MTTKLSERVPYTDTLWANWLKELAQLVERGQEENCCLREELARIAKSILRGEIGEPQTCAEVVYEPQDYDEAVSLCKGWRRLPEDYPFRPLLWELRNSEGTCTCDVRGHLPPWETIMWPDLLKEMNEPCSGESPDFYLTWSANNLKWLCSSAIHPFLRQFDKESFGGAVCGAYLRLKGHKDWADRLCR